MRRALLDGVEFEVYGEGEHVAEVPSRGSDADVR